MRNALIATMFSTLALLASMIINDMLVSLISVAASVLKVAHAYDVGRRYAMPITSKTRHLYPYRIQWMR